MRSAARALAFSCSKLVALGRRGLLAFWPAPRQGKSPQVRSTGPPRCPRHRATQVRIAARRRYNVSAASPKAAAPLEIARFRAPLSRASLLRSHSRGGAPRIKKRELWFRSSALAWPISCVPSNPTHDFDPHACCGAVIVHRYLSARRAPNQHTAYSPTESLILFFIGQCRAAGSYIMRFCDPSHGLETHRSPACDGRFSVDPADHWSSSEKDESAESRSSGSVSRFWAPGTG